MKLKFPALNGGRRFLVYFIQSTFTVEISLREHAKKINDHNVPLRFRPHLFANMGLKLSFLFKFV